MGKGGGRAGRAGDGHMLPLPGHGNDHVRGTGGKCLDKMGGGVRDPLQGSWEREER